MSVYCVNYGESGFVSTQEVIALVLQLKKGNIPDVVIFYDGVNDTFSALQQGIAGIPQNEFNRSKEFNLLSDKRISELKDIFVSKRVRNLSVVRFAKEVLRKTGILRRHQNQTSVDRIVREQESTFDLAGEVASVYFKNMEFVRKLGLQYGFDCYFYWQPTIFNKSKLTDYERKVFQKYERGVFQKGHEAFFDSTYSRVSREILSKGVDSPYVDLSNIFLNVKEPIFLDWMHISEQGNLLIANRMANDISRRLK